MGRKRSTNDEDTIIGLIILLIIVGAVVYWIIQILLQILRFIWSLLLTENIWLNFIIIWGILAAIILRIKVFHKDIDVSIDSKRGRWIIAGIIGGFLVTMNIVILGNVVGLLISKTPVIIVLIFAFIGSLICSPLITRADEKAKKHQEYLQTVPGLFDTAKSLSTQANTLFQQRNHLEALQTYENALTHFTSAGEGAKALKDTELTNTIYNNISVLQKNTIACKNAIGAEVATRARNMFEKSDFTGAIQTYSESLKYFQESETIATTKANIEKCYIEIDAKKVEELSNHAASLLKEATTLNEPFRARELLKQADNIIDEAVTLARKRNFTAALQQLNAVSNNILIQRGIINEQITSGIGVVAPGKYGVEMVKSGTGPTIKTGSETTREFVSFKQIDILRGYEVLPNNDLRFGIRVENNSGFAVMDVQTILDYPKTLFLMNGGEMLSIGNINPIGKRTNTYILKPLGCVHNEQINALITYKDHTGKKQTLHMRPKEVHCVCPFLKEKPLGEGEYSRLAASSEFVQEGISFKGISVEELAKFMGETCRHMLYKVREYDIKSKKVIYLSGESLGEKAYYLLTAVIQEYKGLTQVVLRAHSDKKYGLNGFMNEMADSIRHLVSSVQSAKEIGIIENTQVINIIDSVVQRTSFEMGEGGSAQVNIKDSVVQRSNIGKDK